jgi:flavin-dependent dehydrogenase
MKLRRTIAIAVSSLMVVALPSTAHADSAKPGQSMTHMKTAAGVASTLEAAGVILYVQGGATAAVIGENVSAPTSQVVFHIPVTANKAGVQHTGSNIIFFNTANNQYLTLKNPVIDLAKGVVSATVPQAGDAKVDILTITNASTAKPKITNDKKAKQRTTAYTATTLVLAPGVAATIASVLGLPAGSLPDGLAFGTADVILYSKLK